MTHNDGHLGAGSLQLNPFVKGHNGNCDAHGNEFWRDNGEDGRDGEEQLTEHCGNCEAPKAELIQ